MNSINISGHLTRDPQLMYTKNGKAVSTICIAHNVDENTVYFFDVSVWEKLAENCCKYLKKGSGVNICGSLRQQKWNDADGKSHNKISISAYSVDFLSKPTPIGGNNEHKTESATEDRPDDLPF